MWASLLWHSKGSKRRMEILSHIHVLNMMHIHLIMRMHIWLNRNHWSTMDNISILWRELEISSHWRCVHTYMLIASVLIYIWTSLNRVLGLASIGSCVRHSLVLKRVSMGIERILMILSRHSSHRSKVLMSLNILIHHHIMIKGHLLLVISIWRRSFVLIVSMTVRFLKGFRSESSQDRLCRWH